MQGKEGQCPTDHTDLVPVTASIFWTCKDKPDQHLLQPGKCADGAATTEEFEERAHGDHNPRHRKQPIFMSADLFHHIEGTLVAPNLFRVYFYNEFTKPMKVTGFTARVVLEDQNFKPTGQEIPLTVSPYAEGNALEAKVAGVPVPSMKAPVFMKLLVKLKPGDKDWVTDHQFNEYSTEPGPTPASTTGRGPAPASTPKATASNSPAARPAPGGSTSATKPASSTAATAKPAAKPAATPGASSAAATRTTPAQKPVAQPQAPAPVPGSGVMAAGAEVSSGPQVQVEVLPDSKSELLALLKQRSDDVNTALQQGQLGGVWYPAIGTKDVALALQEKHLEGLSSPQRAELEGAVKLLTVAAWQIDAAGDLGDRERLTELYQQFTAAVADIQGIYGQTR